MTRPDLTRRQVIDRFYYEHGFTIHGGPHPDAPMRGHGFCGLEWQPLPDGRRPAPGFDGTDRGRAGEDGARPAPHGYPRREPCRDASLRPG